MTKRVRILTVLGTRPEIIRLSRIMPRLDAVSDHRVLHTGQNFDSNLSDIFFDQLALRAPDVTVQSRGSVAQQLASMYQAVEQSILEFQPDRVLILGDTNSGLTAVICERMGVPVYHMEAGNRCYDLRVPEEKNRRLIDSVSSVNLPYTELSRQNLLREGAHNSRVAVVGNPIREVIDHYQPQIAQSSVLQDLGLRPDAYAVATAHRAENVDDPGTLQQIMQALQHIGQDMPVVFSCHPRTRARLQQMDTPRGVIMTDPMGFFDWVHLEQHAALAISDSGTVQEEMCLFHRPTITIRTTTERPETVWCGSNIVAGVEYTEIMTAYALCQDLDRNWQPPAEYLRTNVSDTVINILLGRQCQT